MRGVALDDGRLASEFLNKEAPAHAAILSQAEPIPSSVQGKYGSEIRAAIQGPVVALFYPEPRRARRRGLGQTTSAATMACGTGPGQLTKDVLHLVEDRGVALRRFVLYFQRRPQFLDKLALLAA